ncbi:MAG TPA: hypothetical protein VL633_11965, partial [Bacteroidota bacterium]|nr:hypothetical protein [Bacteroidota bacterium]
EMQPWGLFLCVTSKGSFWKFTTTRGAIVADHPARPFEKALVFANPSHQLVFAGQSTIKGDIIVGKPGVTTGNLQNYSSPIQIPVQGRVDPQQSPELPLFQISHLTAQSNHFRELLSQSRHATETDLRSLTFDTRDATVKLESITDSIDNVFVKGDAIVVGKLNRHTSPLYIAAGRNVTVSNNAEINGLVAMLGTNKLTVEKGASIDHAILFSDSSIDVKEGAAVSAQLIAPSITMNSGAIARYPSVLLSMHVALTDTTKQQITFSGNARAEGIVALVAVSDLTPAGNLITLGPQATVVGTIYTNTRVQLDGTVAGTVLTKDFYFYEAPTTYLGWLRSGAIDRTKLPSGFLVPPGFDHNLKLDVLEWL